MTRRASIPGKRIVDPETGRAFSVHPRWPKCRFNPAEAKAARIARTSDPKALAAVPKIDVQPEVCNCEWCIAAQFDFGGPEYEAWLRAHREARDSWPEGYWTALYPALAHVGPVKTEGEVFAA